MSTNNCTFSGRLGRDSELKHHDNDQYLSFSFANDIGYGEKKTTQWIKCTLWGEKRIGRLAEFLKKGQQVVAHGPIRASAWINKESGKAQAEIQMRVSEVEMVGGRPEQQQQGGGATIPDDVPF